MTFDFTQIINAILALAAAVITYYVIPLVKSKTTVAQQEKITSYVKIAVAAAEQILGSGHGAEKMEMVMDYLKKKKIDVDIEMVEATVNELYGKAIATEKEVG